MRSNRDAFPALYDRHSREIYIWFWRKTDNPQTALDLTAETFAQAFQGMPRLRARCTDGARPWLYGIARNLLARYWHERQLETRARLRLGIATDLGADLLADVDERLSFDEHSARLRQAVGTLPPEQREAVQLRIISELDYDEVGAQLGCSPGAARSRVSRGLHALQRLLEGGIGELS
jgi:RNA polymerase sigma-70 factor (ECF subfamily)